MAFNTIMVQLDPESPAAPRLKFGWDLARRFEADMIAFAAAEANLIVPSRRQRNCRCRSHASSGRGDRGAAQENRREYPKTVTNGDPRASWRGQVGDPTPLLALHARAADPIVAGAPAGAPSRSRGIVDPGALILSAGRQHPAPRRPCACTARMRPRGLEGHAWLAGRSRMRCPS